MDPQETLSIINDATADIGDRIEAVENLATWLRRGGAVPTGCCTLEALSTIGTTDIATVRNIMRTAQKAGATS